ncbi:hypothetical protein WOLCODRAFT_64157 [Wolfiporia cocos MD-104 SS10]|uniref:Uncharacterized protein n=1 Tax=Wolfiporia cocos (strain MD-104) TaxID=742152 RepID=A0A2H3J6D3_WOLCO|nr:hypothetical protein WOLCODRAFT_64157 [Wolfiporia cocos MD-104 SS10]
MLPDEADAFVDDVGVKGLSTDYDNETVAGNSNIQRFVYKFACTTDKLLARFVEAGITASGSKLVITTPRLKIVGSIVLSEGWELDHGVVNKILKWPYCESVSEVRGFLGTAGVGRK